MGKRSSYNISEIGKAGWSVIYLMPPPLLPLLPSTFSSFLSILLIVAKTEAPQQKFFYEWMLQNCAHGRARMCSASFGRISFGRQSIYRHRRLASRDMNIYMFYKASYSI